MLKEFKPYRSMLKYFNQDNQTGNDDTLINNPPNNIIKMYDTDSNR